MNLAFCQRFCDLQHTRPEAERMLVGARELWSLLGTGQLRRPDTLTVFVGGVGHFVLIIACPAAFHQLQTNHDILPDFIEESSIGAGSLRQISRFAGRNSPRNSARLHPYRVASSGQAALSAAVGFLLLKGA
jgi:hypothetical protein